MTMLGIKVVVTALITLGVYGLRNLLIIESLLAPGLALWGCVCVFWARSLGAFGAGGAKRHSTRRSAMEIVWMVAGAICWVFTIYILWYET